MKRTLIGTAVLAVGAVVIASALIGFRLMTGPGDTASAADPLGIALDMDVTNGTPAGPCSVIDATAPHLLGSSYDVGICVSNLYTGMPVGVLTVNVIYDDTKNSAPEVADAGNALDDNPDANAGSTTWGDGLGTGWDCSGGGLAFPKGDKNPATGAGNGQAFLSCKSATGPWTLGDNETAGVLGVVHFTATAAAATSDTLTISGGLLGYSDATEMGTCNPDVTFPMPCVGGTDNKTVPPAQCDISDQGMAAVPPAVSLKIGEHAVVSVTETIKNLGAVTPGAPDALYCVVNPGWGAYLYPQAAIDPTKLGVRIEASGGLEANPLDGDICYKGDPMGGVATYGTAWWAYPCNEGDPAPGPYPAPGLSNFTGTCVNTGDDDGDGTCDWSGYSASCIPPAGPDVNACIDVQGVLFQPITPPVLQKNGEFVVTRNVDIECRSVGNFNVLIAGAHAVDSLHSMPTDAYDPNKANDQSGAVIPVFCAGLESAMVKDCAPDEAGVQTACNLWLMDPNFAGKQTPEVLPAADDNGCVIANEGKGCLAVDVLIQNANDIDDLNDADGDAECLGAWEHQVRFDHKILSIVSDLTPGNPSWLESTGRVANCTINVLNEDSILEGCVTTDGPAAGVQNGPCGDGLLEQMLIIPKTKDLIYRSVFRPTKDNGVLTNIVDDNCEITDIYGEPMTGTLPGQLVPVCGDLNITVRMLECDVDLDCDVDVADEQAVAMRYGASWGLQLYNQWFDLEPKYADQDIDIKDLQFCFGRNLSTCQAPIPDDQAIPVAPPQSFP